MTANEWLDLVKRNPASFGIEAGFNDLQALHNNWIKSFLFSKEDLTLQAHRGSYKTTCLAIAIALMMIIYPGYSMIFLRKADDDVKEIVLQIARLLKTDMYQCLSLGLYETELKLTKETAFEIDTNIKTSPRGSSQLIGIGSKASITGKHADIVITDDIINVEDRISRATRERTKLTYQELQNVKNRGGRFINTGTPWHKDDAFCLMPNITRCDCYNTGLIDSDQLAALRASMVPSLFAANYELKHIASEDTLLQTNPIFISDASQIYDGIAHIDAAYGGGDGTAFTFARKATDGNIYIYGELHQKHVDECLKVFEARREYYRIGTAYMERNADKGYLAKNIKTPVKTYSEKMNKFIKISTYLRGQWPRIHFIEGTDQDYIDQIMGYSEFAEHDDAPDSLASIVRILTRTKSTNVYNQIAALKRLGL